MHGVAVRVERRRILTGAFVRLGGVTAATTILAGVVGAQQPVNRRAACTRCSIEVVQHSTVGSPSDSLLLKRVVSVAVDTRGFSYVGPTFGPSPIAVFDPGGALRFGLGNVGAGPGELSSLANFQLHMLPGDTLLVADAGAGRTVLYNPDRTFVRTVPAPRLSGDGAFVRLRNGRFAGTDANGNAWVADGARDVTPAFATGSPLSDDAYSKLRDVAVGPGSDDFWVARRNKYRLELWSAGGVLRRTVVADASWFPEWISRGRGYPAATAPPPVIAGLWTESADRLWVVLHVADERWKPGAVGVRRQIQDYDEFFDTLIEVINPLTNELVASRRLPTMLKVVSGRPMLYSASETDAGTVRLSLFRISLVETTK